MLDVKDLAEQDTRLKKKSVHEYSGPCPGCGGNDRFSVKASGDGLWVFQCRGCWDASESLGDRGRKRGWGDKVDYLTLYRGAKIEDALLEVLRDQLITFEEAYKRYAAAKHLPYEVAASRLQALGANSEQSTVIRQQHRLSGKHLDWQSPSWQQVTGNAIKAYVKSLWDEEDTTALDYARARGLKDETIRRARLGYTVRGGIPRLIVPVYNRCFHDYDEAGWYFAVYRRDLRPDIPSEERWQDAPGGTKNELYLADCLMRKRPTILTEAALDALSVVQECDTTLVNVVATGSANCGQQTKWLARLALMPLVLVAFDADEPGDENAQWWLDRLKNARRLRPVLHDVNDMLMQGWDVEQWVMSEVDRCVVCGRPLSDSEEDPELQFYYDGSAALYCAEHWQGELPETQHPRQVETPEPEPTQDPQGQLLEIARRMVPIFPGGCKVTVHEPGYTIEQRVHDLQAERIEARGSSWTEPAGTQEEYWARMERRFAGWKAEPPKDALERAAMPRTYPAPFPKYDLVQLPNGRYELRTVGMWDTGQALACVS